MLNCNRDIKITWSDPIVIKIERRFPNGVVVRNSYTINRSSYAFRTLPRFLDKSDYQYGTPEHNIGDGIKWGKGKYRQHVDATDTYMFHNYHPDYIERSNRFLDGRDIYTEKCMECNGRGIEQQFNDGLNRWVESNIVCRHCNGDKERRYILYHNPTDFLKKKEYL